MESEKDNNNVMIGIKPFINYVTALKMQFDKNNEVFVLARGQFISKSFDVIEYCRRTFLSDCIIIYDNIKVESIPMVNEDGKSIFVTSIEIKLSKEEKQ